MATKANDIFNISDFMGKLTNAEGELTENQLQTLSGLLGRAKDIADSTLKEVKRARLMETEDIRKAAIEFLHRNGVGTKMEMYNPYNQEDCVAIEITKVSDEADNQLVIEGKCEPSKNVETIGQYGSRATVLTSKQVEFSIVMDDLNFTGNSTKPPFEMSIEGCRHKFCLRGR